MHGRLCTELFTEKSGIAGMVEISMGQDDKVQIAWLAASAF
jgi:hypothetical protein